MWSSSLLLQKKPYFAAPSKYQVTEHNGDAGKKFQRWLSLNPQPRVSRAIPANMHPESRALGMNNADFAVAMISGNSAGISAL